MSHKFVTALLALACAGSWVGLPNPVQAQTASPIQLSQRSVSTPRIVSFTVEPVERLSPGTELVFTLEGTPNSRATLTIGTIARNIPMQEVEPGIYEARYVIRNRDNITANTAIRANLQRNRLVTSARLQQSLLDNTATNPNQNPNQNPSNQVGNLFIDRFTVQPVQQLEPGTDLNFTLVGTPNATATFSIDGITYNQPMREVSQGVYQGQYVIRRQDFFPASGANVTASLQTGNQVVRARLAQSLASNTTGTTGSTGTTSNTLLPLEILSPQNNSQVSGTVEVRGRSAPNTTVAVNVKAVTSLAGLVGFDRNLVSQTVQTDSQGNFSFTFRPSITVPGTRYDVSFNATNGNQTNQSSLVLFQQ